MFLTSTELLDLTGYRRPSLQIAWLRAHRWRFAVNAAGHPRVARGYFEARMVGTAEHAAVPLPTAPHLELVG